MPTPYCHPVDVLRRFDPSISITDLNNGVVGLGGADPIIARVRAVSQEWDNKSGSPMRTIRIGSPGAPATYTKHDVQGGRAPPLKINLDYGDIVPFDPVADDTLEIRTGRDSWDDVTGEAGDTWVLDNDRGQLKLFRYLINRLHFEDPGERFVRLSYRAGGLGGGRDRGGETELTSDITDTATALDVADASRLPYDGGVMYLPDGGTGEYVRVTDVDVDSDTLTVVRGEQGTDATAHTSGTAVHYCPEDVRDAVAAHSAAELVRYDLSTPRSDDDDTAVSPRNKVEQWDGEWQSALSQYSNVRTL